MFELVLDPLPHPSRQVIGAAASRAGVQLQIRAEIEPLSVKNRTMLGPQDRIATIAARIAVFLSNDLDADRSALVQSIIQATIRELYSTATSMLAV